MAALQSVPIWQFDLLNGLVVALRPGYGRRPNMTCGMLAETSAFKLNRQIVPAHQHNHAEIITLKNNEPTDFRVATNSHEKNSTPKQDIKSLPAYPTPPPD